MLNGHKDQKEMKALLVFNAESYMQHHCSDYTRLICVQLTIHKANTQGMINLILRSAYIYITIKCAKIQLTELSHVA